jgi:hypothetical protein
VLHSRIVVSPRAVEFSFRFLFFFIITFLLIMLNGPSSFAQAPEEVVRVLARRVAETREVPEPIAVDWSNVSSLPEPESIALREAFLKELGSRHAVVAAEPSVATLRVSVRETPTNFLLVARIATTAGEQVRMAEVPRAAFLPVMTRGNGLRLGKQLLWQQPETILDAAEFAGAPGSPANIFILKPDAVAIYRESDGRLSEVQELSFGGYKYVSRGLRGELQETKDGEIAATLPGSHCGIRRPATAAERWTTQCTTSTTGTPALHSDAGQATVSSSCDASSWRLITEATDWAQPDRLLLVNAEMKKEEAVAAVDVSGPVRRVVSAEDGKSALAVVFNLSSGSYEVYRITILCGR